MQIQEFKHFWKVNSSLNPDLTFLKDSLIENEILQIYFLPFRLFETGRMKYRSIPQVFLVKRQNGVSNAFLIKNVRTKCSKCKFMHHPKPYFFRNLTRNLMKITLCTVQENWGEQNKIVAEK